MRIKKSVLTIMVTLSLVTSIPHIQWLTENPVIQEVSASTTFRFPWVGSKTWGRPSYPWHGGHDTRCVAGTEGPSKCAVDFGGPGSWGLVSMAPGTIKNVQRCIDTNPSNRSVNVKIDHEGTEITYMHLDMDNLDPIIQTASGNVSIEVDTGTLLGYTKTGDFGHVEDQCGYADQSSTNSHVHLIIPATPFTIDGWTFDYPLPYATDQSNNTKSAGNSFSSTNYVGEPPSCDLPSGSTWNLNHYCEINNDNFYFAGNIVIGNGGYLVIRGGGVLDFLNFQNTGKISVTGNGKLRVLPNAQIVSNSPH